MYADLAVAAADGHEDLVVVAQSMGAFTAVPVLRARSPPAAWCCSTRWCPRRGETAGALVGEHRVPGARRAAARAGGYPEDVDLQSYFLHDVPADARRCRAQARSATRPTSPSRSRARSPAGPPVPTTVLAGRDDRFFPLEFQRRVARGACPPRPQALPGGHLNALSRPDAVTRALLAPEQAGR